MIRSPLAALAALALAASASACGGRLVPSPVEGEPVCADFEIGASHGKMRGSMRFPVTVTLLEGTQVISRATLFGARTKDDHGRVLVPDDNGEYEVRWAQCVNERAPRPLTATVESKDAAQYECGQAEVYKTDKIATKQGDPASRILTFAPPPRAECWLSEIPKAAPAPTPAHAPAPEPTAEPADAGPEPADAGPDTAESDAGKKKKKKAP